MKLKCDAIHTLLITMTCLAAANSFAAKDSSLTGGFNITSNDNVTLGYGWNEADALSDTITEASINYNQFIPVGENNSFKINGGLNLSNYATYTAMNNTDIFASVAYIFQRDNFFRTPWYTLSAGVGTQSFENDIRDSVYSKLGLTFSWRYDDATLLNLGFNQLSSDAGSTTDGTNTYETFDYSRSSYFVSLNYFASSSLSFYGSLGIIKGDIIANWTDATFNNDGSLFDPPHEDLLMNWETIPDDTFGANRQSTKYGVTAQTLTLGFNYTINRYNSTDFAIQYLDAVHAPWSYSINRITLNFMHLF